jgi:sarcosine oxidase
MGSATAYHLARSGVKVLGLDQFSPPHDKGSSHGKTRIIREAYFEHPAYVPLVQRAYELWAELESAASRKLFLQTGGLMIGREGGVLVSGARRSAQEHRLEHRLLRAEDLRTEFPAFAIDDGDVAIWEPRAGILFPELAIQMNLELARELGAELRFGEKVLRWEPNGNGVKVVTAEGSYAAKRLLISAGSWLNSLVPELHLPLSVERQVLFWFDPIDSTRNEFVPEKFPIFIWENEPHRFFYGFPDLGDGVKIGVHHQGETSDPDRLNREIGAEEMTRADGLVRQHLPRAAGMLKSATVCMYTNTPDEHFILDTHPKYPQVVIASPCSGHGFKFAPVVGESAVLLMRGEKAALDLELFKLGRFG